ncbi:MAG: PAS domain-containing protein, partial [Verrucomicrobiota bacterium]|nr:PAS domain-containing protein [Verrucomicrobiota bacterium]
MEWLAFALIGAFLLALSIVVWRQWIAPWRNAEELLETIANDHRPRTFLLGGNRRARRLGLTLEKLSNRQLELIERVHEGEFSVQAILGAMLDGLIVVDQQHRIRITNPAFGRLFEIDPVEIGATLLETVRDASVDRAVTETLRGGEAQRASIRVTRRSGGNLELEVAAVPLREKSERNRGAVILFRDITQLRRVEEVRRDFVANVSHELRTPLSILRGYLETLLENPKQPPGELLRIFEVMEKHS